MSTPPKQKKKPEATKKAKPVGKKNPKSTPKTTTEKKSASKSKKPKKAPTNPSVPAEAKTEKSKPTSETPTGTAPVTDGSATPTAPGKKRDRRGRPPAVTRNASEVIVLAPGSGFLRFGLAEESKPQSIPMAVACRLNESVGQKRKKRDSDGTVSSSLVAQKRQESEIEELRLENHLSVTERQEFENLREERSKFAATYERQTRKRRKAPGTQSRFFEEVGTARIYSEQERVTYLDPARGHDADFQWTETESKQPFIFGDEIFRISPSEPYYVVRPIQRGSLAVSPTLSLQQVLDHIERIIRHAIEKVMKIPSKDFPKYSVALCVPDQWTKREVMEVFSILLNKLAFKELFVHKESVLACFGAGQASACVVDIGASKTHICCIEDGAKVPKTSVFLWYGGDDISESLLWLLQRADKAKEHPWPWFGADLTLSQDQSIMNSIKERICEFNENEYSVGGHEFRYRIPPNDLEQDEDEFPRTRPKTKMGRKTIRYCFNYSTAALVAAQTIFHTQLFRPSLELFRMQPSLKLRANFYRNVNPFDNLADLFLEKSAFYNYSSYASVKDKEKDKEKKEKKGEKGEKGKKGKKGEKGEKKSKKEKKKNNEKEKEDLIGSDDEDKDKEKEIKEKENKEKPPAKDGKEKVQKWEAAGGGEYEGDEARVGVGLGIGLALGLTQAPPPPPPPPPLGQLFSVGSATSIGGSLPGLPWPENVTESGLSDHHSLSGMDSNTTQSSGSHGTLGGLSLKDALEKSRIPLDQAVSASVLNVGSAESKKNLAKKILLVGGSTLFKGLGDLLEDKLIEILPYKEPSIETVNVLVKPKGVDPRHLSWKGAAIVCRGDASKDAWISRAEWLNSGIRMLRERAPFAW